MLYHYQVSGFIEVEAENEEAAKAVLTTQHGVPRAFTMGDPKNKTFVYVVAVGHPQEGR